VFHLKGWTALHYASCYGYYDIVVLLLRAGADVNHLSMVSTVIHVLTSRSYLLYHQFKQLNTSALHTSCESGHMDITRYLIRHGADTHVKDHV
jgi:ankyrin repeat protein